MTAHACTTYNPSCYRCDLNTDELEASLNDILNEIVDLQRDAFELEGELRKRGRNV